MEIINNTSIKNKFSYKGKGSDYALLFFKNFFLTLFTLGLYYPWYTVSLLKHIYQKTEFHKKTFNFTGQGNVIFKSYLKVFFIFIFIEILLITAATSIDPISKTIGLVLGYSLLVLILPFVIHGVAQYRISNTSWNNILFQYTGLKMETFRMFLKGALLSIVTLGVYESWFRVELVKYILQHTKIKNISFDFNGKGDKLFIIQIKFLLLFLPTLGIYTFWYAKNLLKFYTENIKIYQNNKEVAVQLNIKQSDLSLLIITNILLVIFTFGLATPWAYIRFIKYIINNTELEGELDLNDLNSIPDYISNNSKKDTFLSFLDLDLA